MADEPAYVKAFKEFTKAGPTIDDLEPMEREFFGESARASESFLVSGLIWR